MTTLERIRSWGAALRRFDSKVSELYERHALLDRPWAEEFLHWAFDGQRWHLHGTLTPPPGGRRHSVTTSGWCPGLARRHWRLPSRRCITSTDRPRQGGVCLDMRTFGF